MAEATPQASQIRIFGLASGFSIFKMLQIIPMCHQVWQLLLWSPDTQSVVHRPATSVSPGRLFEMQTPLGYMFMTNKTWEHFSAAALIQCQHVSSCLFQDFITGLWPERSSVLGVAQGYICALICWGALCRWLVPRKRTNESKGAQSSQPELREAGSHLNQLA